MYVIKMTTDYFGTSHYKGEGRSMNGNLKNAKRYDDKEIADKHCRGLQKFWNRYKVEVVLEEVSKRFNKL